MLTALLLFFLFGTASLTTYVAIASGGDAAVRRRLLNVRRGGPEPGAAEMDAELQTPLVQRLLEPFFRWFYSEIRRLAPASVAARTRLKLNQAGVHMDSAHFLGIQALAALFGAFAMMAVTSPIMAQKPAGALVGVIVVLFLGWRVPDFWLSTQITARRRGVERSLPDVLDLLSVSVEAGLGFDGAAQKVSEKFPEPVSGEFREYLKAIRLGSSRSDALRAMADRVDLSDMRTFCAALIQADQLGVSIGKVLRAQSESMRVKRKQRVEEKAMQLPLKLLFPLILFIFPTIFIVVLGPVIIQFLTVFTTR